MLTSVHYPVLEKKERKKQLRNESQVGFVRFITVKLARRRSDDVVSETLKGRGQNSLCHLGAFRKYCPDIINTCYRKWVEVFE